MRIVQKPVPRTRGKTRNPWGKASIAFNCPDVSGRKSHKLEVETSAKAECKASNCEFIHYWIDPLVCSGGLSHPSTLLHLRWMNLSQQNALNIYKWVKLLRKAGPEFVVWFGLHVGGWTGNDSKLSVPKLFKQMCLKEYTLYTYNIYIYIHIYIYVYEKALISTTRCHVCIIYTYRPLLCLQVCFRVISLHLLLFGHSPTSFDDLVAQASTSC